MCVAMSITGVQGHSPGPPQPALGVVLAAMTKGDNRGVGSDEGEGGD